MMTTGRATPAAQKRKTRPTLLPASTAPWTCSFLPLTRHRPTCLCLMISQRVVILCHPSITLHGSRNTQMYQSKVAKTGRPSHNCSPLHTRHPKTTQPSLHSLIQPSTRRVKILSRSQPPVARLLRPDVAPQGYQEQPRAPAPSPRSVHTAQFNPLPRSRPAVGGGRRGAQCALA